MPNKQYVKGRKKEYKITAQMKRHGYDIAQRTAGSHSPFDVIGIRFKDKQITLVQSKPSTMTETQKKKIEKENKELNGIFQVFFKVI